MRNIFLIIIFSSFLWGAFSKNGGVVTDSITTLQWQDDYSDNSGSVKDANWTDAIGYCENLSLDGYSDWRLPNKRELISIVDYSVYNPSLDSTFENNTSSNYWSSTSYASNSDNAWIMVMSNGYTHYNLKTNSLYVRCVRGGQYSVPFNLELLNVDLNEHNISNIFIVDKYNFNGEINSSNTIGVYDAYNRLLSGTSDFNESIGFRDYLLAFETDQNIKWYYNDTTKELNTFTNDINEYNLSNETLSIDFDSLNWIDNSPKLTLRAHGGSLQFDGSSSLLATSSISGIVKHTVEMWINTKSINNNEELSYIGDSSTYTKFYKNDSGNLVVQVYQSGVLKKEYISSVTINDGDWHHVAYKFWFESGTTDIDIVVDGVESGVTKNSDETLSDISFSGDVKIANNFSGLMDEVRVWNVTKTVDTLKSNMNKQIDPSLYSSLKIYYNFDERVGDNVYDLTSNNYHTTIDKHILRINFLDNGLLFDGANDYVSRDALSVSGSKLTIGAWIKPDDLNSSFQTIARNSYTDFIFRINEDTLRFEWDNTGGDTNYKASYYTISSSDFINKWNYVASTFSHDGSGNVTIKLYINGEEVKSETISGSGDIAFDTTYPFSIGANVVDDSNLAEFFKGSIAKVSVWTKVLSSKEIQEFMYVDYPLDETNLFAYWALTEKDTIAYDIGPSDLYNGTITGASWIDNAPKILGNNIYTMTNMYTFSQLVVENNTTTPTYGYSSTLPSEIIHFESNQGTFVIKSSIGDFSIDLTADNAGETLSEQFNIKLYDNPYVKQLDSKFTFDGNLSLLTGGSLNAYLGKNDGDDFIFYDAVSGINTDYQIATYDYNTSFGIYDENQTITIRLEKELAGSTVETILYRGDANENLTVIKDNIPLSSVTIPIPNLVDVKMVQFYSSDGNFSGQVYLENNTSSESYNFQIPIINGDYKILMVKSDNNTSYYDPTLNGWGDDSETIVSINSDITLYATSVSTDMIHLDAINYERTTTDYDSNTSQEIRIPTKFNFVLFNTRDGNHIYENQLNILESNGTISTYEIRDGVNPDPNSYENNETYTLTDNILTFTGSDGVDTMDVKVIGKLEKDELQELYNNHGIDINFTTHSFARVALIKHKKSSIDYFDIVHKDIDGTEYTDIDTFITAHETNPFMQSDVNKSRYLVFDMVDSGVGNIDEITIDGTMLTDNIGTYESNATALKITLNNDTNNYFRKRLGFVIGASTKVEIADIIDTDEVYQEYLLNGAARDSLHNYFLEVPDEMFIDSYDMGLDDEIYITLPTTLDGNSINYTSATVGDLSSSVITASFIDSNTKLKINSNQISDGSLIKLVSNSNGETYTQYVSIVVNTQLKLNLTNIDITDRNITNIQVIGVDGNSENFNIPDVVNMTSDTTTYNYSVPVYNIDQNFSIRFDVNISATSKEEWWYNFSDQKLYSENNSSDDFKTLVNGSNYEFNFDGSTGWVNRAPLISSTLLNFNEINPTQIKLTPFDGAAGDSFGYGLAVSNDYAVVGSYGDDDLYDSAGSAYLYNLNSNDINGSQIKLTAFDVSGSDRLGERAAISDKYVALTARYNSPEGMTQAGAVYLYDLSASDINGTQIKLTASDMATNYAFGYLGVGMTNDYLVVASTGSTGAYLFDLNADDINASQIKLTPTGGEVGDTFGMSIDISKKYIAVGASYGPDATREGEVYLYDLTANNINDSQIKLTPNDGESNDYFGKNVEIVGNYLFVASYTKDVYVFDLTASNINDSQFKLSGSDSISTDTFGYGSIEGSDDGYFVVGVPNDDDYGTDSGVTFLYNANESNIAATETKLTASDAEANDKFGEASSMSDKYILIGAYSDDGIGSAYLFSRTSGDSFSTYENNTSTILTVGATDPDGDTLTYTLSGTDSSLFNISTTGEISFKNAPSYDEPTDTNKDNIYELSVTVNDGKTGIVTKEIKITVKPLPRLKLNTNSSALSLDSSSSVEYTTINDITFDSHTIEFWMQPVSASSNQQIVQLAQDADNYSQISLVNGAIIVKTSNNTSTKFREVSSSVLNMNEWYHVAYTYDKSTNLSYLYINAKEDNTTSDTGFTSGFDQISAILKINGNGTGSDITIDELRIYNNARTIDEIKDNMNKQLDPSLNGIVLYYNFDENHGSTAYDIGDGERKGSILGTPTWVVSGIPQVYGSHIFTKTYLQNSYELSVDYNTSAYEFYSGNSNSAVILDSGFTTSGLFDFNSTTIGESNETFTAWDGTNKSTEVNLSVSFHTYVNEDYLPKIILNLSNHEDDSYPISKIEYIGVNDNSENLVINPGYDYSTGAEHNISSPVYQYLNKDFSIKVTTSDNKEYWYNFVDKKLYIMRSNYSEFVNTINGADVSIDIDLNPINYNVIKVNSYDMNTSELNIPEFHIDKSLYDNLTNGNDINDSMYSVELFLNDNNLTLNIMHVVKTDDGLYEENIEVLDTGYVKNNTVFSSLSPYDTTTNVVTLKDNGNTVSNIKYVEEIDIITLGSKYADMNKTISFPPNSKGYKLYEQYVNDECEIWDQYTIETNYSLSEFKEDYSYGSGNRYIKINEYDFNRSIMLQKDTLNIVEVDLSNPSNTPIVVGTYEVKSNQSCKKESDDTIVTVNSTIALNFTDASKATGYGDVAYHIIGTELYRGDYTITDTTKEVILLNQIAAEHLANINGLSTTPKIQRTLNRTWSYVSLPTSMTLCTNDTRTELVNTDDPVLKNICYSDDTIEDMFKDAELLLKYTEGEWTYYETNTSSTTSYNMNKFSSITHQDGVLVKKPEDVDVDIELPYDIFNNKPEQIRIIKTTGWHLLSINRKIELSKIKDYMSNSLNKELIYVLDLDHSEGKWQIYAPTNDSAVSTDLPRIEEIDMFRGFWIYVE
jgi:hypothetical protein